MNRITYRLKRPIIRHLLQWFGGDHQTFRFEADLNMVPLDRRYALRRYIYGDPSMEILGLLSEAEVPVKELAKGLTYTSVSCTNT